MFQQRLIRVLILIIAASLPLQSFASRLKIISTSVDKKDYNFSIEPCIVCKPEEIELHPSGYRKINSKQYGRIKVRRIKRQQGPKKPYSYKVRRDFAITRKRVHGRFVKSERKKYVPKKPKRPQPAPEAYALSKKSIQMCKTSMLASFDAKHEERMSAPSTSPLPTSDIKFIIQNQDFLQADPVDTVQALPIDGVASSFIEKIFNEAYFKQPSSYGHFELNSPQEFDLDNLFSIEAEHTNDTCSFDWLTWSRAQPITSKS